MPFSILDTDLYKLTMQQAVLDNFPNTIVTYKFNNRNTSMKFTHEAFLIIKREIEEMRNLALRQEEYNFLKQLGFFKPAYLEYLRNYRFNPSEVSIHLDAENNLQIDIAGTWHSTILWEVPLMSIISETYFRTIDRDWTLDAQLGLISDKGALLSNAGCVFADFGTRRRRNGAVQQMVVNSLARYSGQGFVGTSNVLFAMMSKVKPLGTMAHEWIMGLSALRGLRHCNHNAMYYWVKTYDAALGTALPDTYGTDAFLGDFDLKFAKMFDGVRHDSGDPKVFTDKVVAHYRKLNIDPTTKTIVFSDGLDVPTAIDLKKYCETRIRCSFGIGTNFTNDFKNSKGEKSKPLNMVIKLQTCDGIPVVKLSDTPSKAIGDRDAVRVAKWTFFGTPLDENI